MGGGKRRIAATLTVGEQVMVRFFRFSSLCIAMRTR